MIGLAILILIVFLCVIEREGRIRREAQSRHDDDWLWR